MMKRTIALLAFLTACGSSPKPQPAAPTVEPLPSDPAAARGELALRFVRAVSARDEARMTALIDARGFCTAGMKVAKDKFASVDACVAEMEKANTQAFTAYEQGIPAGSTPGATDEYALDATQGVYQINVHVDAAEGGLVAVIEIALDGRPYIVFPVKKEE